MRTPNPHVQHACKIVGGPTALAKALSITPPTVSQWLTGARPVPLKRAIQIEKLTGIQCELLCREIPWLEERHFVMPCMSDHLIGKLMPPEIPADLQNAAVMLKGLSGKFADEDAISWFLQLKPKTRAEMFELHDCITSAMCIDEINRNQQINGGQR